MFSLELQLSFGKKYSFTRNLHSCVRNNRNTVKIHNNYFICDLIVSHFLPVIVERYFTLVTYYIRDDVIYLPPADADFFLRYMLL